MKNRKLSGNFLLISALSVFLLFVILTSFYISFMTIKIKNVEKEFRSDFERMLTHVNYILRSEKDKFELIISSPEKIPFSPMTHFKDFYSVTLDGKVKDIFKRSNQFFYYKNFDISMGELYQDLNRFKNNMVYFYGPFYSVLTKEQVIALIYKTPVLTYIAHIDLSLIPEFKEYELHGHKCYQVLSSKDGIILLDSTHSFPNKNIPMEEGNITVNSKSFYHILNYIPLLNLYSHLIIKIDPYTSTNDRFQLIFIVLMIVIIIIALVTTIAEYLLIVRPVNILRNDVLQMDLDKTLRFPDPYYEEFSQIRRSISELLKRIQMEIHIEKNLKDYYDNIINSFPNLIITMDNDENIVMINDTAVEFFGKTVDKNKKMKISEIISFSPEERDVLKKLLASSGNVTTLHNKRIMKDKTPFVFNIYIYPLVSEEESLGFAFILIDVTQHSLMEEQLLQTQKQETIGILAGGFAHDFNNLLTIIIGNLDVYRYTKNDDKRKEQIDAIYNAALRASELIKQILNFSRKEDAQLEPVLVEDVLTNVIKIAKNTFPKNIRLLNNILTQSSFIMGDNGQLIQAFLNILLNARDAISHEGIGKIEVSTEIVTPSDSNISSLNLSPGIPYIRISITDNGKGISDDQREHIFDPFFSTKERGNTKGLGLGLAIVYSTIQRFHGAVDFESFAGKGTVFFIYLPLYEHEITHDNPPDKIEKAGIKQSILIVDDDPNIRKLGQKFLNLMGHESKIAINGKKAELVLKENEFDLIILDMIMPDFDGLYLLEQLREKNNRIPVVISTGHFEEFARSEFGKYEFIKGFIDKPFTLNQFTKTISEILSP
ncbi:MAG: response regulator [Brevinematales bacterium]|nr:response regulator [Brevinematales bacterium]